MTVLCIILALALVGLFFSRIHFHFTFGVDLTRSSRLHSAARPLRRGSDGRERKPGLAPRSAHMAMGTAGKEAGVSGGAPAVRTITREFALQSARDASERDLCSALVNLGMDKKKAVSIAKAAMVEGEDFDSRFQWAVKNAA